MLSFFTACTDDTEDENPSLPPVTSSSPTEHDPPSTEEPVISMPDLPEDQTVPISNSHIGAGEWAFVLAVIADDQNGTVQTKFAVRVKSFWQAPVGALRDRPISSVTGSPFVDLGTATPYFISWSYVVIEGNPDAVPPVNVMPTTEGVLYLVDSAYSDRDCPDYLPSTERGIGVEVEHCLVSVSNDGGKPQSLFLAVPGESRQFWFFDLPAISEI